MSSTINQHSVTSYRDVVPIFNKRVKQFAEWSEKSENFIPFSGFELAIFCDVHAELYSLDTYTL